MGERPSASIPFFVRANFRTCSTYVLEYFHEPRSSESSTKVLSTKNSFQWACCLKRWTKSKFTEVILDSRYSSNYHIVSRDDILRGSFLSSVFSLLNRILLNISVSSFKSSSPQQHTDAASLAWKAPACFWKIRSVFFVASHSRNDDITTKLVFIAEKSNEKLRSWRSLGAWRKLNSCSPTESGSKRIVKYNFLQQFIEPLSADKVASRLERSAFEANKCFLDTNKICKVESGSLLLKRLIFQLILTITAKLS